MSQNKSTAETSPQTVNIDLEHVNRLADERGYLVVLDPTVYPPQANTAVGLIDVSCIEEHLVWPDTMKLGEVEAAIYERSGRPAHKAGDPGAVVGALLPS